MLRLGAGDNIRVFDGQGREHRAVLTSATHRQVVARVDEEVDSNTESPLVITLMQGISRGDRMDFVIQKSTELGVSCIVPVMTARSVVRLDDSRAAKICHDIAKAFEEQLTYPGEIKVTVVRESRFTELAR